MKRNEFIKIIKTVMKEVENDSGDVYTCNRLEELGGSSLRNDYISVFGDKKKGTIRIRFMGSREHLKSNIIAKPRRLNALSTYLAQSLTFGTYKNL